MSHIKINSDENEKMFPLPGDNNQIINNSQFNQQQKTFYNTKKNSFIHIENHINYSSTINNIVSNISNKTPKKITKGHHKTNSDKNFCGKSERI